MFVPFLWVSPKPIQTLPSLILSFMWRNNFQLFPHIYIDSDSSRSLGWLLFYVLYLLWSRLWQSNISLHNIILLMIGALFKWSLLQIVWFLFLRERWSKIRLHTYHLNMSLEKWMMWCRIWGWKCFFLRERFLITILAQNLERFCLSSKCQYKIQL